MDISAILFMATVVFILAVAISQNRFKNKMQCYFIRPNRTRITRFVPLHVKEVVFDKGRYGIGQYRVDPNCVTLEVYDKGINKIWPTMIPTLEFKWDTPNPIDPKTFQSTWHTPEARRAAWEEHQHISFAKAAAGQAGKKSRIPEWFLPAIAIVLILAVIYVAYTGFAGMEARMGFLEQQIKLLQ